MPRCLRALGVLGVELDLLTAPVVCLAALILAIAILATTVTLTLTLPYDGGATGFGALPGPDSTVIVRSISSAAAN